MPAVLKKLELFGFKSFAQKTALEFPSGLTTIVGPNGSGKSNIIDGVRWLLGEREAKNIRGGRITDLIFAGTPQRAKMGFAQAALTFDNSEKIFPLDFSEVVIKRRLDRDGNSQYFVNESEVRMKDVIDLFAKAKLGTKGFTIINQGEADIFVRVAPKERRVMIEEILGLRQYQLKKHDAENKLKATQINLEKAGAVTEEILPHLRLLRRQASKWSRLDEIKKELQELEDKYFAQKYHLIKSKESEISPRIEAINKSIGTKQKELEALEVDLRNLEAGNKKLSQESGIEDIEKLQNDFWEKKTELEKELARLEIRAELIAEKSKTDISLSKALDFIGDLKRALNSALMFVAVEEFKGEIQEIISNIDRFVSGDSSATDSKVSELDSGKEKIQGELQRINGDINDLVERKQKIAEGLKNFNKEFRDIYSKAEDKRLEINRLSNDKNSFLLEKGKIEWQYDELKNEILKYGKSFEEISKLDNPILKDDESLSLERKIMRLRGEIFEIGEIDQSLLKEAQETENRYQFLSSQIQDLEKSSKDLTGLIKELDEKIHDEFKVAMKKINEEFNKFFRIMFGGGQAHLTLEMQQAVVAQPVSSEITDETTAEQKDLDTGHEFDHGGIDISVKIPGKKVNDLEALSGGEKSLVSLAALFALISVSPPPFLVLDEVDAALDERNTRKFAGLIKSFSDKVQFILVTHNRATMEAADVLYGVTMKEDGVSSVLSLKLKE